MDVVALGQSGHTRLPKVRTAAPPSSAYRRRDYAAAHRLFLPLAEAGDDDTKTNCSDASKAKACSETLLSRFGGSGGAAIQADTQAQYNRAPRERP